MTTSSRRFVGARPWRAVLVVAALLGSSLAIEAVASAEPLVRAPAQIYVAPPAPRREFIPRRPARRDFWIGGHWAWGGRRWEWMPGYWQAPLAGFSWMPGHWMHRGRVWFFAPGRWVRVR